MRCRSRGGTLGYYTRRGSFCGRTSVHVPKHLTLGLGPPSGVSIGRLSGVGALWDCVSRVCGGGGGCAGGGVPRGAGPCCPDVGRCLSGVNIIIRAGGTCLVAVLHAASVIGCWGCLTGAASQHPMTLAVCNTATRHVPPATSPGPGPIVYCEKKAHAVLHQ